MDTGYEVLGTKVKVALSGDLSVNPSPAPRQVYELVWGLSNEEVG